MTTEERIDKKLNEIITVLTAARDEQHRFTPMILYIVGFGGAALAAMAIVELLIAIKIL